MNDIDTTTEDDIIEVHTATVTLEGVSPYSQSRFHEAPKKDKESPDEYEKRTWKERVHRDADGIPFMPPMSLKITLEQAARYLGKIPGMGASTYKLRFLSGILITEAITLTANGKQVTFDDWEGEWLHLNSDGVRGGGKRVKRCMPRLFPWTAHATIHVLDGVITKDVLAKALTEAGRFVGIGRFRPEKGGFYGRFKLAGMEWQ